jgi:hypothetical protein
MSANAPPAAPPVALAGELVFDAFYLAAIWILAVAMVRRARGAEARRFSLAFLLLAFTRGEPGLALPLGPWRIPVVGAGALGTAITITGFYALIASVARLRRLERFGALMLVSLACHLPVLLLVQTLPAIGLLMIPKTIAYLAMAVLVYRSMATMEPITSR